MINVSYEGIGVEFCIKVLNYFMTDPLNIIFDDFSTCI